MHQFEGWQCCCCNHSSDYDYLIANFRNILREYSLTGYHCTKLTREEIENIRSNGLVGQNGTSLSSRIDTLLQANIISSEVANDLKSRNQANEINRAHMLWFCFFEPYLAGEYGIRRFFRSWGGEALYNYHEDSPVTGEILRKIGIPCIIKANVPISSMNESKFPDGALARVLLSHRGHQIRIPIEHEGYSTQSISPQNIIEIIEYPSEKFSKLTRYKTWDRWP